MKVLDTLSNAHMLMRSGAVSGNVSFQHPQFQEWFASFWVQELILAAASGDNCAIKTLREDVLDIPIWEEAILFACDRLSRMDRCGTQAVAWSVLEALSVDPLLSAEIIYRSSDDVWQQARDHIMSFTDKWYTEGRIDRAVQFMINTGRAEFSRHIWPLISDADSQIHLRALRSGRRFRTSVLGSAIQLRIAALPEQLRAHVIAEIAINGEMDGIELATRLAKNDASAKVQEQVIASLLFRRAGRFVKDILKSASDEVWRSVARRWLPNEFADPQVSARIAKEAGELLVAETDPRRILHALFSLDRRKSETGPKIRELIENMDFSENTRDKAWLVQRAYERYPNDVVDAIVSQLESGRPVPSRTDELLRRTNRVIDEGPLVERVLQSSGEGMETAVSVVGSKTIGQLIDQMIGIRAIMKASNRRSDKGLIDEYNRLCRWISNSKAEAFIYAVLERAKTKNPDGIVLLADLISRHGGGVEGEPLRLDAAAHGRTTDAVRRWAEALLASPEATRAQFAEIAQAAERLGSPSLVPVLEALLSEDLARLKRAQEEFVKARKNGHRIDNDAHMRWDLQYRRAFAAIGDDHTVRIMKRYLPHPDFGCDAAHVLKATWRKSQPKDESWFLRPSPDFSVVPNEYIKRQSGTNGETLAFVNDILAVVDDLIKPGAATEADYSHALKLATVAFSLLYVDKDNTIVSLLQLPLPPIDKRDLLTVLVLSGETIPSELVLQGIDELLRETQTNPWMLREQGGWRLNSWLRLLPFTDNLGSILNVLDRLEARHLGPWKLHELLSALSYAPSVEAEDVLSELAKRDEQYPNEGDWLAALIKRNTLTAARILLDFVCNASSPSRWGSYAREDLGRGLSALMTSDEQLREEVYERFLSVAQGPAKLVLEHAIAHAADAEAILLLTREGAANNRQFGATSLYSALRHRLVGATPIESSRWEELHSLPARGLRRKLFDLVVNGSAAESRLAAGCLSVIDEIRDNYGHVDAEPRHPNIRMGVPWPQIGLG